MIHDLCDIIKHKTIQDFYNDKKPLYIYGIPGCGKTTIGDYVLKDYIIEKIDSFDIKKHKDIYTYLMEKSMKKNISMMFKGNYKNRAYFIDDLDVFYKNDKKSFKGIIKFLKESINCKVVISFNEYFIKNKELIKIDHYKYYVKNENLCIMKQIRMTKILYNESTLQNDIQYSIDNLFALLILRKKDIQEIIDSNMGDENQFLLNILENIYNIVDIRSIIQMYDNYVYYDMIELYSTGNHLWELKEYSKNIILRGIYIYTKKKKINMKNNAYISKSILTMSNSRYILDEGYIYLLINKILIISRFLFLFLYITSSLFLD